MLDSVENTSIAIASGRTSRRLRDLGESPVDPQSLKGIFWVQNNCGNEEAEAVNAACVCWCFDMPLLAPIRTSNLGLLIPVSSRTLGGSSPISGSHSWTEKGISERVPFFQDGWMIRFYLWVLFMRCWASCLRPWWAPPSQVPSTSGLLLRLPASFWAPKLRFKLHFQCLQVVLLMFLPV